MKFNQVVKSMSNSPGDVPITCSIAYYMLLSPSQCSTLIESNQLNVAPGDDKIRRNIFIEYCSGLFYWYFYPENPQSLIEYLGSYATLDKWRTQNKTQNNYNQNRHKTPSNQDLSQSIRDIEIDIRRKL